ncbi:MAG: uroporphyrinogen-III synthase [Gammaproteobacteria bacterium]
MSSRELDGVTVLVTRPRELAEPLCAAIEAHGGKAVRWPGIEIESRIAPADATDRLGQAGPHDIVIFVSRNAVTHGADLLRTPIQPKLAAIGPSTAAALRRRGLTPDILSPGHDSESLLAHPALTDFKGNAFIVRGVGGRELLAESLGSRGAEVIYLEVYQRQPSLHPPQRVEELLRRWADGQVQLFTATSVAILDSLYNTLGPVGTELLNRTPLVTASPRVIQRAEGAGHHAQRLLSEAPDDAALLEAITSWRHQATTHPAVRDT